MARPQKFRLTPDEVLEPQHARKLAGHVSEIEFFRKEIDKLQQQVADIYDAADEDGFDKKFVRKAVAKRAKDSSVLAAEEQGLEAYEMAIEKGMATRARERNPEKTLTVPSFVAMTSSGDEYHYDAETGEITEPQPAKAAGQAGTEMAGIIGQPESRVGTSSVENEAAEISTPITPKQVAPHPASDLTTSPSLSGQVAPIQESPRKAAEAEGESPARQADASASAATSDRMITTNVSGRMAGVTAGETATNSETGRPAEASASAAPLYAAPGVVTEEHTPPEPVKRHPISAAFADLGQNRQELRDAIYRRAGGVAKPIVKIGCEILDGFARYDIARGLFIDYPVQQYAGTDILVDAINWNLESRKLTGKEIQTVITRLVKLYPDREQEILGMFDAEIAEAAE